MTDETVVGNAETNVAVNRAGTSPLSITGFQPDDGTIPADSIQGIAETCLIEIWPEVRYFEDENSDEADAYFASMDDWQYYMFETRSMFADMGVNSIRAEQRYLSFTFADGVKIVVDTEKEQNGFTVDVLLYKEGHIPIVIHIIPGDNDMECVNDYLNSK